MIVKSSVVDFDNPQSEVSITNPHPKNRQSSIGQCAIIPRTISISGGASGPDYVALDPHSALGGLRVPRELHPPHGAAVPSQRHAQAREGGRRDGGAAGLQ